MADLTYTFYLALYGSITSTAVLLWSIVKYYLDNRTILKINVNYGFLKTNFSKSIEIISFNVVNKSKKTMTVEGIGFNVPGGGFDYYIIDPNLPKKLDAGEGFIFHPEYNKLKANFSKNPPKKPKPIHAWIRDQNGDIHRSKDLSKNKQIVSLFNSK